jgi:predicted MPP superfamily phosphohydrolase
MAEFPVALQAIQGMESRYGTYLCEGNHDLIPGPLPFHRACAAHHLSLLYNSNVTLPVRGRNLIIGGLPWYRRGFQGHTEAVSRLYPERREGDLRILLAHHPDLFDIAQDADLVLSGHTHGGQIMVGPVGFGPLFFKYWSGLYRRGNSTMVVSNGAGDWFPCRIGAPAEIARLRLTRAG